MAARNPDRSPGSHDLHLCGQGWFLYVAFGVDEPDITDTFRLPTDNGTIGRNACSSLLDPTFYPMASASTTPPSPLPGLGVLIIIHTLPQHPRPSLHPVDVSPAHRRKHFRISHYARKAVARGAVRSSVPNTGISPAVLRYNVQNPEFAASRPS